MQFMNTEKTFNLVMLLLCNYKYFNMQTASAKCKFKNSKEVKNQVPLTCANLKEVKTVHGARNM